MWIWAVDGRRGRLRRTTRRGCAGARCTGRSSRRRSKSIGLEHETAWRWLLDPSSAFGVGTFDQLAPASAFTSVDHCDEYELPTAKQLVGLEHEIAFKGLVLAGAGPVLTTRVHVVPFQRAMSDCDGPPPAGDVKNSPTAKQVSALGHETPWKMLRVLPGFGLATIDHAVPFQRSTRVSVGRRKGPRVSSASEPTAKQLVAVAHDTLSRRAAPGLDVGTWCAVRARDD